MADLLRPFRRRHAAVTIVPEMPAWVLTAMGKAELLLRSKLTARQKSTFDYGYFDVEGSRGGHYRINTFSTVQNIDEIGASSQSTFCVGLGLAGYYMPKWDVWLFQKILIESNEELFLRTAERGTPYNSHDSYNSYDW